MTQPQIGQGVIIGKNVEFGKNITIWHYTVIGDNTKIGDNTRIGSFVDIGKDVTIGKNCVIQAQATISNKCKIGNKVFMGPNSSILNDRFPYGKSLTPSTIEDNVILGGCVTILPDITVGQNSVIAAGSVAVKDIPPQTVVKGVPATTMMTRKEYEEKKAKFIEKRKQQTKTS